MFGCTGVGGGVECAVVAVLILQYLTVCVPTCFIVNVPRNNRNGSGKGICLGPRSS